MDHISPDAILVLAGGLKKDGIINEWVKKRLDDAIYFFNKKNVPIICLGGGTYHKPPVLNERGFVIHEATACVNYLKNIGKINPRYIYKEWSSYDTIGNVYFSFVNHIRIMDVKNILIITSQFHMERAKLLFDWIYNLNNKYNLIYHPSENIGLDEMIEERMERERQSIEYIQNSLMPKIKTLEKLHDWLYLEHNAYCSRDQNIEIISENVRNTY